MRIDHLNYLQRIALDIIVKFLALGLSEHAWIDNHSLAAVRIRNHKSVFGKHIEHKLPDFQHNTKKLKR
jgi:hypothetical protein